MGSSTEDKRRVFIRVVLVCLFVSAIVSDVAIYAAGPIDADGKIVAWGIMKLPDQPLTNLTQIAPGGEYSLGLKADGSIVGWGYNTSGQCDVPSPNTNFSGITAGLGNSLGLKTDGSIVAWGSNGSGQCDVPLPNAGYTAVAAGFSYSLGLKGCAFDLGGDFNNDCRVGMLDLAVMGGDWMMDYDMLDCARMGSNWLIHCNTYPYDPACVPK